MSSDHHIAARFGYGVAPVGPRHDWTVTGPDPALAIAPAIELQDRARLVQRFAVARAAEKASGDDSAKREVRKAMRAAIAGDLRADLARAAGSPQQYRERLVRFWADHFTVTARNVVKMAPVAAYVDQAIRANIDQPFGTMFRAAVLHPVMLIYLDQSRSFGPNSTIGRRRGKGLNENLAREAMELHSLGVDSDYDQKDVTQLAELLTGLTYSPRGGFRFVPGMAEPGAETVLGRTYGGGPARLSDIHAALDDLANHPDTARHIATKLATHFVADDPPADLVHDLAEIFRQSGGNLPTLHSALADHPAAQPADLTKARQPFDLVVAGLRALGVPAADILNLSDQALVQAVSRPLAAMGQPWRTPGGPDGWPERAGDWITPQGMAARISWAMSAPRLLRQTAPDPRSFLARALGPTAREDTSWAAIRAESRWEGVGLILASPEFNRR